MKLRLRVSWHWIVAVLAFVLVSESSVYAWHDREPIHEIDFGRTFFNQLRKVFGHFRDSDLQRVFNKAGPIQCSDLAGASGEWLEVGFFNEYREFGNWYRTSLDQVRSGVAVYSFKSDCAGKWSPVQVITRFPIDESTKAYEDGKIDLGDIKTNINPPVTARFDSQTGAYTFDLPYLFRISDQSADPLYALNARTLLDHYALDVTSRWSCKSVSGTDVTYQFLICHTMLVPTNTRSGKWRGNASYGTSAFSILSDGKEASSSVTLTFGH